MTKKSPKRAARKAQKEWAIVLSQDPELIKGRKFKAWCQFFYDESNKDTYLNATKSALKAYRTQSYGSAAAMGCENYKKLKNLNPMIADIHGYGVGERIKIALAKAMQGNYSDWDKLLVRLGDFEDKPASLTQNNFHFDNLAEEIAKSRQERGLQP